LIDDGAIGTPISATANMLCHGHESWHPAPEFFYQKGGGPLFDMGPYYLASLVTMLGPVKSLSAHAKTNFAERTITSQPLAGKKVMVETPTYLTGLLEFQQGALATVTMSFDTWAHHLPMLEIYGTEGSISCPDPNTFGGEVQLWTTKTRKWEAVALTHSDQVGRGIGLADFAYALREGVAHRMNGDLGLHILEVMETFLVAAESHREITLKSTCAQPIALPVGEPFGK
jgi:predicted dehydrogenase